MTVEIRQELLDGIGMPAEWALSIVVPIYNGKGAIRKCIFYRAMKVLEHLMVAKRVLEKSSWNSDCC